jgi:hypothetical protein
MACRLAATTMLGDWRPIWMRRPSTPSGPVTDNAVAVHLPKWHDLL